MDSDDYKELKEQARASKMQCELHNTKAIKKWCEDNKIHCYNIQNYQIRICANDTIDIFPQSKKYHNISQNRRGQIKGKIVDFLKSELLK